MKVIPFYIESYCMIPLKVFDEKEYETKKIPNGIEELYTGIDRALNFSEELSSYFNEWLKWRLTGEKNEETKNPLILSNYYLPESEIPYSDFVSNIINLGKYKNEEYKKNKQSF